MEQVCPLSLLFPQSHQSGYLILVEQDVIAALQKRSGIFAIFFSIFFFFFFVFPAKSLREETKYPTQRFLITAWGVKVQELGWMLKLVH